MKESSFGLRCAAAALVFALAPAAAMAYIDPGNGAYMVQALFTLVGAAIFYLRHPIRTLKSAWHSLSDWLNGLKVSVGGVSAAPHDAEGSAAVSGVVPTSDES